MDHTKLVIALLIFLGTVITFGSPITEDYPEEYSLRPEEYSEGPEEYPELSPDSKELDTLRSDPDMGIFHEMAPNSKELEALLRSDPALGNYVPNSKEQKEMLSNSSDQYGKKVKRVELHTVDTIIAGFALGFVVLKSVLGTLASVDRKIAIGIDNESFREWTAMNVYFYSGTSSVTMPHTVKSGEALVWGATKSTGFSGAVGVLTYCFQFIDNYDPKTLAVMYSVPYSYLMHTNEWNVKVYDGCTEKADKKMYEDMYKDNPFKGDLSWYERALVLGPNLKFKGTMSGTGQATLQIKVYWQ